LRAFFSSAGVRGNEDVPAPITRPNKLRRDDWAGNVLVASENEVFRERVTTDAWLNTSQFELNPKLTVSQKTIHSHKYLANPQEYSPILPQPDSSLYIEQFLNNLPHPLSPYQNNIYPKVALFYLELY
jgi:hypothetical protein